MTTITLKQLSAENGKKLYSLSKTVIFLLVFLILAGKSAFSQIAQTYPYTGAMQTYVVVSTGTYQVETWGAQGGANWVNNTNFGGYAKAIYSFTAGTVLNIFVGQQPTGLTGGYNGGGNGEGAGTGGGGASDVRLNGTALGDRIVVAGGGGGAGYWSNLHIVGGVGGGLTGGDGYRNTVTDAGGQGGTQTGSGNGTCISFNNPAMSGGLGYGGAPSSCGCEGYGGGGGYYGGGGSGNCRGGGGGSGFISASGSSTVFTSGTRLGNGEVIITQLFSASISQSSVACNGGTSGSATVTASGVAGPYTYSWIPSGGTNSVAINLAAGSYTCFVSVPGTTIQPVITITEPSAITSSITSQANNTCNGGSNGSASLSVTGGIAPYTYTWAPSGGNTVSASGLAAGIYTVNIRDMNNCASARQLTITQPSSFSITASATSPSICNGNSTTLSGSGAATYTWSGGITNAISFSPTITTTYSLTAKNAIGCAASNTAVITVTVHNIPVISVNSGSVCSGKSFTMTPSGAGSYTFTGGTNIVSPTANTSYSVTGTSTAGCISSAPAVSNVSVIALPSVSVNSGSICAGASFTLIPSGASTYTFSSINATVSPATSTSYSVTGTSSLGCVSSNTAVSTITVQPLPLISVNSGSVCNGQSFTLNASGANTYTYSGGSIVAPAITTSYSVTGTSTAGCISAGSAISTITVYTLPLVSVNSGSICNGESFTLSPSGANTYTFSSVNAIVSPSATSSYSITGSSAEGCLSSNVAVSTVTVETLPVVSVNSGSICIGESFTLTPAGADTYTFSSGNSVVSPSLTASYSVTGTSTAGCVSSNAAVSSVTVNALPVVSISGTNAICAGNSATLTASGATTYSWNNTANTSSISVSPPSTTAYSITGTDVNGCKGITQHSVTVNSLPVITFISSQNLICVGQSASITATGAQTYLWSGGETSSLIIITPVSTTTYSAIGTDINGCKGSAIVTQSVSECTGITAVTEKRSDIFIYPNPNTGEFTINTEGKGSVSIINELGQTVSSIELKGNSLYQVSLKNLPGGIYFLTGKIAGQVIHKKIIITN